MELLPPPNDSYASFKDAKQAIDMFTAPQGYATVIHKLFETWDLNLHNDEYNHPPTHWSLHPTICYQCFHEVEAQVQAQLNT
ncbi:hypothetical protein FQN51_008857, partial [Onygenales sp. PD_10]